MNETRQYWFRAKRYGWGWGLPLVWQGWVVMLAWMAVMLAVAPVLAIKSPVLLFVFTPVMVFILIGICYAKGEPPRWRWGEK